jgi:hypothetical protein
MMEQQKKTQTKHRYQARFREDVIEGCVIDLDLKDGRDWKDISQRMGLPSDGDRPENHATILFARRLFHLIVDMSMHRLLQLCPNKPTLAALKKNICAFTTYMKQHEDERVRWTIEPNPLQDMLNITNQAGDQILCVNTSKLFL